MAWRQVTTLLMNGIRTDFPLLRDDAVIPPQSTNYYSLGSEIVSLGDFNIVDILADMDLEESKSWTVGTYTLTITLERKPSGALSYGYGFHIYDINSALVFGYSMYINYSSGIDEIYLTFIADDVAHTAKESIVLHDTNDGYIYDYPSDYGEGAGLYNFLIDNPVAPTKYEPVSYLKGNMTFTSLSMIKKAYTNEGEAINVGSNTKPFERLINPTLEALGNQLALNTERNFAYSDDDNYVSITKTLVDGDDTTYVLKYYIDGVEDLSLRQTYVCTAGEKHYFSFIFDSANEAARPSVIREYPVVNEVFHEYNQETVTSSMLAKYYEWLGNSRQSEIPDPYNQGSEATSTDNPSGSFDRTNDPVNFPTTPATSLLATGFFRAYLASKSDLGNLATFLWSAGFDLDTLKKICASPIDSILHCLGIPLALTSTELLRDVYLGNVNSSVQMKPVSSQVVIVDCGSIDLDEFYGSYLDYAPYTRLSLYLPYIGVVGISVDDVMGKEVSVKYYVDVLTGACLALVKADDNVLYHYTGACGIDVPLTASDYTSVISGLWGAVTTVASGIATAVTGGAAAPLLVGSVAQTANNVMASKPQTQRSGSFTAITGLMDVQYPHIILEIPEQCHVNDQNKFKGYPIHKDYTLSDLTGYTEIEAIHLENMTCTDTELQEIETLLEGGVIL